MNPKQDSENLMRAIFPLAEKMLEKHGEFYPYGGYLKPDGEIVETGAADSDNHRPKSNDLIYLLRRSCQEMARARQCDAVAIIFNVTINLPYSDAKSDAVQVCLDHTSGYSVEVFFPYQIVENQLIYGETFAQAGKYEIFNPGVGRGVPQS